MKKHLQRLFLTALIVLAGGNTAWALTANLSTNYELAGYVAKTFYDFTANADGVLPTAGDLRFRDGYGLYNFGSGARSGNVSISVTEGQLLVCQFADTQNRGVTINSISGCTKSTTISDAAGHLFFEADSDLSELTFNVGRGGCVVSLLVMDKDESAQATSYTINYLLNGAGDPVKTVTGEGVVGGTVLTDASFFVEQTKYYRSDNEAQSFTLQADGNTFNVSVRLAADYSYTVSSSLGTTLGSGTYTEGEKVYVPYPRYALAGGKFYEASVTNNEYRVTLTMTADNMTSTVNYEEKEGNVVFYTEGEDIEGMTANVSGNVPVRASNAKAATSEAEVAITTLPAGKYVFHVGTFTSKSSVEGLAINFSIGSENFSIALPNSNRGEVASQEFELTAAATLSLLGMSANTQLDYIYVQKTGDVEAPATETVVTGYTVDFNTAITTSNHDFKVAKGWGHIVPYSNYDDYGPYYMSYSYGAETGVDGTGALFAGRQYAGDYSGGEVVSDILVTPLVSGTVTIAVKASSTASNSNNAFIEVYTINADGTLGSLLKTVKEEIAGYNTGNNTEWATVTLADLAEAQQLGLRLQYVYVDNFAAATATLPKVKQLDITGVANLEGQTGYAGTTTTFAQQADGTLKVQLKVTLANSGDYDLAPGAEGYSLTLASASNSSATKTYYEDATVDIAEALAAGETKTISVDFAVPYTAGYKYWFVRENISNTTSSAYRYANTAAYESKFVFRAAESTATSSLTAESWGTISESTTKQYEIANTGTAPMTITAITLPEGFTSTDAPTIPAEGLVVEGGQKVTLSITQDAATSGTFAGNLVISYIPALATEATTYTLAFAATVIGANTWTADFNNPENKSTIVYPAGTIAEAGITGDYTYSSGNYNNYIKGRNTSSYASQNNKFITPKLHATAGAQLAFDVKAAYSSSDDYFVKVYVSADRVNWGEPVETYVYSTVGSNFSTKTISFDAEGDYYVAFALFGDGSAIDNIVGLEKVAVAHDLYIKSVSWPDASIKSGTAQTKPSVDIIPLTNETADAYTVKYVCGETVLAEADAVALTASANSSKTISFSWTPAVEQTTTYPATKVVFEFTDGTKFETETFDLTVTNEAIFHFVNSLPSSKWYEPTDRTAPITFGKTNTADTQSFIIYNWGSAALTVNSISLPEGFTTTTEFPLTVAAFDETNLSASAQTLDITFSAAEAGTYSGDMVITYSGDKTFTLPISGTKLDPAKFYANFGDGDAIAWPAGAVYQSNIRGENGGTYSAPDYYITSSSTTNNLFITPKLTAQTGDKLQFDAKLYSTSWSEGKVVVYAAATRDELVNFDPEADTRTPIFTVSGQDETSPMTTDYQTFEIPAVAGDNYYAFEISGRPYVDEIYGLKVTEVAHDWMIASSNIPTEGMQNVALQATVNILNLGVADEAADSYTATLYVDGEAAATAEALALPMTHQLSAAGTALSFSFRSPKVGTFPVYIEVKAGDYMVTTDLVDVTFAEEVPVTDAIEVGTRTNGNKDHAIVDFYNADNGAQSSDIVYTAAQLNAYGITAGAKITALEWRASVSFGKTINNSLTAWVGMKSGDITPNSPDKTQMTEIVLCDGQIEFVYGITPFTINLPEPIVYDGTSDLRVYFECTKGGWASVLFDYDDNYQNMYWSNASAAKGNPLLYVTLDAEPATIAGTVKDAAGAAIADATVTLVSTDGDNVQYTGTTDAEGAYSINVIQTARTYNVTASAEGYQDQTEENVSFAEGNVTKDFTLSLAPVKGDVSGDGVISTADAVAIVNIALSGNEPTAEQLAVADMNNDGQITTADAVALVQLALEQEAPAGARRVDLSAGNRLSVNGSEVSLSNADEFVAFQMDVTLADDALLQGVQLADRVASHEVAYRRLDANTWRIAVFSLQNDAIMHNAGQLLQLQVSGSQQVALSNVEFVTADARACAVGLGETTGIHGVSTADASARYYNAAGQQREQMHKGMNIVVDRNGKAVKVLRK